MARLTGAPSEDRPLLETVDVLTAAEAIAGRRGAEPRLGPWCLVALGIRARADGFACSLPALFTTAARLWAVVLCAVLLALFAYSVSRFEFFSPIGLVEEAAHTYASAENYLRFGLLNTWLLQDFSTSSDPADHPFAYNHMPPGPDLITAALLKATGHSYRATRLILAGFLLLGLVVYVKFANLIAERVGFGGAGVFAVMFLVPGHVFSNFDRHNTALMPLVTFIPLVAVQTFYRTGRARWLATGMTVAFVSAVYLEYVALAAVIFSWIMLYLTQVLRVQRRHVFLILAAIGVGVAAHLLQNVLYLGLPLAWRELQIVLLNRIWGYPTLEELRAFYQSIGLIHHGSHPIDASAFVKQLVPGFNFPGAVPVLITAVSVIGFSVHRRLDYVDKAITWRHSPLVTPVGFFGQIFSWAAVSVTLPLCLFPAFAQEVSLHGNGTTGYFFAIVSAVVVSAAIRVALDDPPRLPAVTGMTSRWIVHVLLWAVVLGALLLTVRAAATAQAGNIRTIAAATREFRNRDLGDIRERFSGSLYMTNISTVSVGFLVGETGWGVCGLDSISETGNVWPPSCHSSYMRHLERYAQRRPRYFLFFWAPELFPGYSECLPTGYLPGNERGGDRCVAKLFERLSTRFKKVFENRVVVVFDLDALASEAPRR